MRYISEEAVKLLQRAQNGDTFAEEDLLVMIRSRFMIGRISRYLSKNRIVDNDDIKQEFLIGAALAIGKARIDVGDPIEYLLQRGVWRVKSYMRKHILQNTFQVCNECGSRSRLNKFDGGYICNKCGCTIVETYEINNHDTTIFDILQENTFEDDVISELLMAGFKATLTPGTNVYALYELLEDGVDRHNPAVRNYMREIARIWGGCSEQNVVQTLNKLRDRFQKYMTKLEETV